VADEDGSHKVVIRWDGAEEEGDPMHLDGKEGVGITIVADGARKEGTERRGTEEVVEEDDDKIDVEDAGGGQGTSKSYERQSWTWKRSKWGWRGLR